MLDFSNVRDKSMSFQDLTTDLAIADLEDLTQEMIDHLLNLIRDCNDEDVVFVPDDPLANDPYASTKQEVNMPWTLGHVIVHITASSEESAFLAAELSRGVPHREARSRFEVHWSKIKTIRQCRERLEESRRMQLACLKIWPDEPHLDNCYESRFGGRVNPITRHVLGLYHADSHINQIVDIISQVRKNLSM